MTITKSAPRFRSPSITAIESVFPGKGKEAKAIFRMRRSELESLPDGSMAHIFTA